MADTPHDPRFDMTRVNVWTRIHQKAFSLTSPDQLEYYYNYLRKKCKSLPCSVCRGHCQDFLEKNDPRIGVYFNLTHEGRWIGAFYHSVYFHNSVNERLGKKCEDFKMVFAAYSQLEKQLTGDVPCSMDCGK